MVKNFTGRITITIRRPWFWIVLVLLVLIALFNYREELSFSFVLNNFFSDTGLARRTFEKILYLAPVLLAGVFLGWKSAAVTSLLALAIMLPRDITPSQIRTDNLFGTGAVFAFSLTLTLISQLLYKEKNRRYQLEDIKQKLTESEKRYQQFFDDAYNAIFIHDSEGKITAANKNFVAMTGYKAEELCSIKVAELLSEENALVINAIEQLLNKGENTDWTTEVKLIKKNKGETSIQLSIRKMSNGSGSPAFLCTAQDMSDQKSLQENTEYYLQQATRAQEEERKRIALELHDESIQDLVVLSRQLDILASKGKELSTENGLLLKELRQQVQNIIQSLRNLSQDLRPATLDRLGLLPALGNLTSEITRYSGIAMKVNTLGAERRLPEEVELVLFRIAQEALRNVARHSKASKSEINLEFGEKKVRVSIKDDGKGFYVPERMNDLSKDGKLGLIGMQERARLINGHLSIQSEPGKGTCVIVEALV